ncbi:hypothetical protein FRC01_012525 [Tulasnella sp. 417]|nr:hypothetical protein FRC01_012525 [Tulasnella sp. 417]
MITNPLPYARETQGSQHLLAQGGPAGPTAPIQPQPVQPPKPPKQRTAGEVSTPHLQMTAKFTAQRSTTIVEPFPCARETQGSQHVLAQGGPAGPTSPVQPQPGQPPQPPKQRITGETPKLHLQMTAQVTAQRPTMIMKPFPRARETEASQHSLAQGTPAGPTSPLQPQPQQPPKLPGDHTAG